MLFAKNEHIASYRVLFPQHAGPYAETYRVKDGNNKTRCLKLISHNLLTRHQTDDDGHVVEVEMAKTLHHHNLCSFVDAGTLVHQGAAYTYLVTEYISGETLAQKVARGDNLEVFNIKSIGRAVLDALAYLHSLPTPIIHNGITLQNVLLNLVGTDSDLKVVGFGHATYLGQTIGKPKLDAVNPFYLAPECFAGTYSPQSDIYAVGAMMYFLLFQQLPWYVDTSKLNADDRVEAILNERKKELTIPSMHILGLDAQLVNTIAKALAYEPDNRFHTAAEFIQAIDDIIVIPRQANMSTQTAGGQGTRRMPVSVPQGKGFDAIAGMDDLKELLREEVIDPLHHPEEHERYGLTIPNGMLLYGPPGCGKTFFAKHFAEEVGFHFMLMTPASLKSKYVNATQENIAKMFEEAEKNAPCIIFIDEFNELVPNRESDDIHEMSRSAVNEMLAQMDRTGERGIFVIGATNYPHMIDTAILRAGRIEKKYYIGLPDNAARTALFQLYLRKRPCDDTIDYDVLSQLTDGYVSADIQLIVNNAARQALKSKTPITMTLLTDAIHACTPSLTKAEREKYERIKAQMDGTPTPPRPKIGF